VSPVWAGVAIGLVAVYIAFHAGSGAAHYRHQRAGCAGTVRRRRPSVWASLGRGPYVRLSVPIGGGFRLTHKL
jgi:hypothetical protein